ncbi:unnamed protein product, partial [Heterosigma akashiwo]
SRSSTGYSDSEQIPPYISGWLIIACSDRMPGLRRFILCALAGLYQLKNILGIRDGYRNVFSTSIGGRDLTGGATMGGKKHLKPHREEHERLRIVYYVTGRGFGHATRAIEICRHLIEEGHDVCICSTVPEYFFKNELPDILYRECEVDTAVIQHDAMTVSRKESLELYYSHIHEKRDEILQREKEFLEVARPDCVAVDAAPVALAAAAAAGRPAALVSNFRWDYIYRGILASLTEKELPPDLAARYEAMLGQMNLDY